MGAARDPWRTALATFTERDHPDTEQVQARLRDAP